MTVDTPMARSALAIALLVAVCVNFGYAQTASGSPWWSKYLTGDPIEYQMLISGELVSKYVQVASPCEESATVTNFRRLPLPVGATVFWPFPVEV